MLIGDKAASSWSIKKDVDNGANCPILLKTSIIEVVQFWQSCSCNPIGGGITTGEG
jgi:hypothetical protein